MQYAMGCKDRAVCDSMPGRVSQRIRIAETTTCRKRGGSGENETCAMSQWMQQHVFSGSCGDKGCVIQKSAITTRGSANLSATGCLFHVRCCYLIAGAWRRHLHPKLLLDCRVRGCSNQGSSCSTFEFHLVRWHYSSDVGPSPQKATAIPIEGRHTVLSPVVLRLLDHH
jgi:hypothetical protein